MIHETHFVCNEVMERDGAKSIGCCCTGHKCATAEEKFDIRAEKKEDGEFSGATFEQKHLHDLNDLIAREMEEFEKKLSGFLPSKGSWTTKQIKSFLTSLALTVARATAEKLDVEDARYRRIAELISAIFFYGDFKAETESERDLEQLLREVNLWPTNEEMIVERSANNAERRRRLQEWLGESV